MTGDACEHWRGLIALQGVGTLAAEDGRALAAHVERCPSCRQDHDQLVGIRGALDAVDPGHLDQPGVGAGLERAVLGRLADDARHERRRMRMRVLAGAGAGVVAAAAAIVALALVGSPAATAPPVPPPRTLALHGRPGVTAAVRLVSERWGTAVRLTERGLPGGEVLWVSMRTTAGTWWEAGTYTTVAGQAVTVDMACALGDSRITGVRVIDGTGHTELAGGYADPS